MLIRVGVDFEEVLTLKATIFTHPISSSLRADDSIGSQRLLQQGKVRLLKERFSRAYWVAAVSDDHIKLALVIFHKLKPVANEQINFW